MARALFLLLFVAVVIVEACVCSVLGASPSPTPWPLQFHSLLFINSSKGTLQATDLWYDWPNGRNFNIIHNQLRSTLHDLEWTNGTSFYYDLDAQTCTTMHFDVGILRPDWLVDNSIYLGQQSIAGFTCNVWSKADFITYYEDVETNRPVYWVFYTGMSSYVMSFEVGAVLEDSQWQAPGYCFNEETSLSFATQKRFPSESKNEGLPLQDFDGEYSSAHTEQERRDPLESHAAWRFFNSLDALLGASFSSFV